MPSRIQRKRSKGWRMPVGVVYVGRGSRYGNPFVIGEDGTRQEVVDKYRALLLRSNTLGPFLAPLRGKDLACWCPLDQPCHADMLLKLANAPEEATS